MIYRKAPPRPTRFLLKVVAAGAGALLSVACGGSEGSAASPYEADAGDAGDATHPCDPNPCGLVANPEAGDEHPVVGVVPNPEAGDESVVMGLVDAGIMPSPEAGADGQDEDVVLMGAVDAMGVVVNPEAGHD
jgi:hypothetical protein